MSLWKVSRRLWKTALRGFLFCNGINGFSGFTGFPGFHSCIGQATLSNVKSRLMSSPSALAFEKGLPSAIDAERFVLGSILLDDSRFVEVAGLLTLEDFAIEKHRRIFERMAALNERNEKIDRLTLAHELMRYNELESVDGVSYIVSLDDGLPRRP